MKNKAAKPACEICRTSEGAPVTIDGFDMRACRPCLENRHVLAHAVKTAKWWRSRGK